jgi:hypothetical protein
MPDLAALRVNPYETEEWIVWREGDRYFAKSGLTGRIEYDGDSAADAINYAVGKTTKGVVYVKYGVYEVKKSINLKSGVRLVSDGAVLKAVGTNFHVINITGSTDNPVTDVEVRGFEIDLNNLDGASTDIMANGINVMLARRVRIADLYIHDETNDSSRPGVGGICIINPTGGCLNYSNYDIWVVNNYVKMRGVRQSPPIQVYDAQRYFEYGNVWWGSDPDVEQSAGKRGIHQVSNIRDAIIRGNYFYRGHHNAILFYESSASGRHSENVVIADNIFVEPQDDHIDPNNDSKMAITGNIFIHGPASAGWVTPEDNCEDIVIAGNYFFGAGYIAIVGSRRVTVTGNVFADTREFRNYIRVTDSSDVTVSGNTMHYTTGVSVEGASKNILVVGNRMAVCNVPLYVKDTADRVLLIGNVVDSVYGSWARIFEVQSSTCTNILALWNMRGSSGRIGGPRLRTDLDPNINPHTQNIAANQLENPSLEYPTALTKNAGTATIPAGSTSVTVNHGLRSAPSRVLITPLAQPLGKLWVANITSTSFNIVTDTAPTANLTVAWYAEV